MKIINIDKLVQKVSLGYIPLDIRAKESFEHGTIPNAINVNKGKIIAGDFSEIDKNKKYIVFCGSGNSAKIAYKVMEENKIDVLYLKDGYSSYAKK